MFSIGNNELENAPIMKKGDKLKCHICGKTHKVLLARTTSGEETDATMFFECGKNLYLCGVDGKSIMSRGED